MIVTITSTLRDGAGDVLDTGTVNSHNAALAVTGAALWARGALERADDPDAYVEHSLELDD